MTKNSFEEMQDSLSSMTKDEALMFCYRMGHFEGVNETLKTEKKRVLEITSNALKEAFAEIEKKT